MTKLTALIESTISGSFAGAPNLGAAEYDFNERYRAFFENGTGANQANNVFIDRRTINASSSENIDLAGVLSNALGTVLTFTAIKVIRVRADAGNINNVIIGGAASNTFTGPFVDATDKLSIPPGGMIELVNPSAAGWPVVASTGDILLISNGGAGTAVNYSIEIVGEA